MRQSTKGDQEKKAAPPKLYKNLSKFCLKGEQRGSKIRRQISQNQQFKKVEGFQMQSVEI